jgi:hypothetical protein
VRTGNRSRLILRAPHTPLRAVAQSPQGALDTGLGGREWRGGLDMDDRIDVAAVQRLIAGPLAIRRELYVAGHHRIHHATASQNGATRNRPAQMPRCRAVMLVAPKAVGSSDSRRSSWETGATVEFLAREAQA